MLDLPIIDTNGVEVSDSWSEAVDRAVAARLDHPHILSVHDCGEAAGQLWFTMPYVEGESLRGR